MLGFIKKIGNIGRWKYYFHPIVLMALSMLIMTLLGLVWFNYFFIGDWIMGKNSIGIKTMGMMINFFIDACIVLWILIIKEEIEL